MNNVNTGKIVQISGPVIDVQFESGVLPKIREALSLTVDGRRYVMEVAQHVGDNTVRCVMLSGSEGLSRGMQVEAPGKTIEVPVGENTLGRMFNVLGDPIDGGEAVPATEPHKSIYRKAPSFDEQNPAVEILETGIKVIVSSVNHKISVYDPQMKNTPGMAARVFSAIAASDADIRLITTSEVEISLLVTEADYDTVLEAIEEAVNAK